MLIALMRHGQTDWNLHGRVQGRTDIPLNDTGRNQVRDAATAIRTSDTQWASVTSSPLARARESAEIAATVLNLPLLAAHEGLIEQHYGEAEGVDISQLEARWPDRRIPGGETPSQVRSRALRTLDELAEQHEGTPLIAVTHGAYVRRLVATLLDIDYQEAPRIENAGLSTVEYTLTGWKVRSVNGSPSLPASGSPAEPPNTSTRESA